MRVVGFEVVNSIFLCNKVLEMTTVESDLSYFS